MAARARDSAVDHFKEAERRLNIWGDARRSWSKRLGMPSISNIAQMIAHIRAEERKRRADRKKALRRKRRAAHKARARGDEAEDLLPEESAELAGFKEAEPTSKGKQKLSRREQSVSFSGEVVQIEAIVRSMPGWMQTPLYRTYVYNQPHRIAARELMMDEEDYRSRWRAGVRYVAVALADRRRGAVQ